MLDPERAQQACDAATAEVDMRCGQSFPDPAPHRVGLAALYLAVRWYQRVLAPLGTMGGFDTTPVYVRGRDPDVDMLLVGHRVTFGVA